MPVTDVTPDMLRAIIYAPPGHGKSTFAAGWYPESNVCFDMDRGTTWLPKSIKEKLTIEQPNNYAQFQQGVNAVVDGSKHPHAKVLTVDTLDTLVRQADSEAGARSGKVAAGLVDFGRGLADRDGVITRELRALTQSRFGLLLIAHDKPRVVQQDGRDVEKIGPRIDPNDRITKEVEGMVDFIFYVTHDHQIVTGGDPNIVTKRRIPLPDRLPADPAQLYAAIRAGLEQINSTPNNTKEKVAA